MSQGSYGGPRQSTGKKSTRKQKKNTPPHLDAAFRGSLGFEGRRAGRQRRAMGSTGSHQGVMTGILSEAHAW